MTVTKKMDYHSVENERILRWFVQRDVHLCVSSLVHHFATHPEALKGSDYNEEDVIDLCQKLDWQTPVEEHKRFVDCENGVITLAVEDGDTSGESSTTCDNWEDAADVLGVEPYDVEVFEHWAVSEHLAEQLHQQGEIVGRLFDLTIWGRCTSGQSISSDAVIGRIAEGMGILDGQQHSWAE